MKYEDALNTIKKYSNFSRKNSILVTTEKDLLARKNTKEKININENFKEYNEEE